jgi:hypothetical protein
MRPLNPRAGGSRPANDGRITTGIRERLPIMSECINYPGNTTRHRSKWRNGKQSSAHRLAWEDANGPIPDGMHVLHSCHNPACVNPDHLRLGTHQDNMRDRQEAQRQARGSTNGRSKLTEDQVLEIWKLKGKVTQRTLAERFGVSIKAVGHIHSGYRWRHVTWQA